jgi:hypothetical protein
VSFPKDDPNHYALYRLFIIARFCAPPFPDALVETSRQRPSPAPEIGGRILLYALSVPVSAAPAFLPNMPFRLDADFVPVIKIRPHTTFWSPISPGRPSQSPELVALLNSQPDILIRPLKREHDGMAR